MATSFDPYYKWLGIPPAEQPPHYYRLLGVTLFEPHPDVIESAADQRMVHLRSFQTGQHAAASQKLLNEVSAAKLCLLKPEKKTAYDAKLKAKLGNGAAAKHAQPASAQLVSATPLAGPQSSHGDDWQVDPMQFAPSKPRKVTGTGSRKSSPPMPLLVGGPIAGIVVVAGILIALNNGKNNAGQPDANVVPPQVASVAPPRDKHPVVPTGTAQKTGTTTNAATIKTSTQPASKNPFESAQQPKPATPSSDKATPQDAAASPDPVLDGTGISAADLARRKQLNLPPDSAADKNPAAKPDSTKPDSTKPADETKPADATKPDGDKPADGAGTDDSKPAEPRVAVPDEAAQQKALQQVKDILKDEYAQAKNAEGQLTLAKKLQKLGTDTKNDPAERYVTYTQALDLATKAGDPALAVDLIDTLNKGFELDVWDLRQKTLMQLARSAKSGDVRATIARNAVDLAEQALPASRFDTAVALATTAGNLAASTKDGALRDQARDVSERAKRLQKDQPAFDAAMQKLKANADDPDANLVVGRFKCLLQDDWKTGLPYLAKASDDAIKTLAKLELADPTAADDQVKVADGWWDQAEKKGERKDDPLTKAAHARAMYWYRLAQPNLTGLNQTKVQKRIDADEAAKPEAPITETAYLDDLNEQNLVLANASLGKHGATGYERNFGNFGRGPGGGGGGRGRGGNFGAQAAAALSALNTPQKVALGGVEAKHALSLMPKANDKATVAYNLDGKYRLFTGTAALMDGENPQAAVIFRVLADGKPIWTSRALRRAGDAQEFTVRVAKATTLQLEILCNGANTGAHTAWINAAVGR